MSKFGAMKQQRTERTKSADASTLGPVDEGGPPTRPMARHGKKAVSAYFSPEVSRGLNVLAAENDTTLQALMGEAIDLLMRQYGKHPFGER
jgi:hypothetical protein